MLLRSKPFALFLKSYLAIPQEKPSKERQMQEDSGKTHHTTWVNEPSAPEWKKYEHGSSSRSLESWQLPKIPIFIKTYQNNFEYTAH